MNRRSSQHENILFAAIGDVFGSWRPAVSWGLIIACGVAGWCAAPWFVGSGEAAREWLRPWACAGYGIAAGGLLTLLPRAWKLMQLNATLSRRPSPEILADEVGGWWPIRLVAAALRYTPLLRMTAQDFAVATAGLVGEVRGLLAHRSWPACAAAFTAPVFGLVSAWLTWGRSINAVDIDRQAVDAMAAPFGVVAWPMIFTILAGLMVMLAVVVIDQMTCGLMQRWSTNVRFEDAAAPGVQARLANLAEPISPRPEAEVVRVDPVQTPQPEPRPEPRPEQALVQPPTVSDLKKLEDLFRDG
jgi:hypothetical protein